MKSTKLFISTGIALLATVSFFATKAEKKFVGVTSARLPLISTNAIMGLSSAHFTTIKGVFGKTVFLITIGASLPIPPLDILKTDISTYTSNVYWH